MRSRVRRLATLYAASWIIGAVVAVVLVLGLVDYLLRFQDPGIRVICSLAVLGVLGWTSYRYLFLGLFAKNAGLPDVALARRLQQKFPTLGDGLASAVEFLRQPGDDPAAGSVALRRAVIAQATAQTEPLDFRESLTLGPTLRAAVTASAICLVALLLALLDPLSSRIALARLVNPFGNTAWPQTYHLTFLEEIRRVAKGQAFEVEVVDRRGLKLPSDVRVHYRFENPEGADVEESERMQFVDGKLAAQGKSGAPGPTDPRRRRGVMVARREKVTRPFSYRVEGGDDRSMPWIPVEVPDPPAIESLSVTLIPPDYTGWPSEPSEEHIRALVGTRVQLTATSTKPLESAFLCLEGGEETQARLGGPENRSLAAEFVVDRSHGYWFRLTDAEGLLAGDDDRWEIRAVPDAPPTVSIEQPSGNVFVTPQAVVPLRVAAKDDLAIHRVDLVFSRSDRPEDAEFTFPVYEGPSHVAPQPGGLSSGAELGHNLVPPAVNWELAGLGLEPGTQITFHATATDYQPLSGQSDPRRLVIITPEELTERIAGRQAAILSELSRVLQIEKQSRRQVGDLEIRLGEVGRLNQLDIDHLRGAELNQRQVKQTLTSPGDGVPMLILGLLADLENNKVDSPDVERRMTALSDEIDRLAKKRLPVIERELTAAIKAAQVGFEGQPAGSSSEKNEPGTPPSPPDPAVAGPMAEARNLQDEVVASLEQMLEELGQWDQYRRFHARISQLLRAQEDLREGTRDLGSRTLTKALEDLLPEESADLKILAQRQFDLARDLDGVQQEMQRAAAQLRETNPLVADTVSDAFHRARELAVSGQMRLAAGNVQRNQMGQAIERQAQVIADLRELLDILANRREHELGRLVRQLRAAEAELAEMARQEEGLRKEIEAAGKRPDEAQRRRELERLGALEEQLEEQAERMARRLERLLAEAAGQTVTEAAKKMQEAAQSARQSNGRASSQQADEAGKKLDEALRQVAERRLEAEVQLALEQMARLEEALEGMHGREEKILEETLRLDKLAEDQGRLTRAQAAGLHDLARGQGLLQSETVALTEKLVGADVFNLALSGAAREMGRAAALLDRRETGAPAQQAEQNALRRLEQLLEALKPEEADEEPEDSGSSQGGPEGSRRPPGSGVQTLVELKLLKLLQQEINLRTRELEETLGPAAPLTDDARREYTELSEEQGRLADLLLDLIRPEEDPEDNPELLPGREGKGGAEQ